MYRFVFGGVVMVAISSLAIILLRKKYLVVFGSLCRFFHSALGWSAVFDCGI